MGTHIERLLSDLESGSDDDRSVAHSCRVELDTLTAERERMQAALGAFINAHNTAVKALYEDGTLCDCPYCKRARAALPAERDEKERQS